MSASRCASKPLTAIDPDIDWRTYAKGITVAVLRWMIDHTDGQSLERILFLFVPLDLFAGGAMDAMYHDSHDCTTGTYRGGPIMPDIIATSLLNVLQRDDAADGGPAGDRTR